MFWGLIMEPNKRYTQTVEKPFHISQAAMDISTGDNDACQVMVVVDQKNFLVCTLQKGKAIQVPLDLYFKAGASVAFLTNGKCNVHLTGYLDPEFEDDESEGDEEAEEEEEEEAPTLVQAKNKRKLDNSTEAVATKKSKKQANKKPVTPEDSDSSDDDVGNDLQKILNDEDLDSDENDESFKVNASAEVDSDEDDSDEDEDAEDEEDEDEDDKDEMEDSILDTSANTSMDTSVDTSKTDEKKLSKSAKRRLKKKEKQQQQQAQVNGIDKSKSGKVEKSDAQQKKAEKKQQQEVKKQKEPEAKAGGDKKEKKTLTGGVYIEDLKVGEGPAAKSGKTVLVYYEGRLKQNNKMFDSCLKGAGFKFRLGSKEVITGWDVGIAGMKVGGKRKIVCPPAMGYGAKGSPPVIPPNSTLVFEVELKNVK